jgi:hypothetical protein
MDDKYDKEIKELYSAFESNASYERIYALLQSYFKKEDDKIRRLQEKLDSCRAEAQMIIDTLNTGDK